MSNKLDYVSSPVASDYKGKNSEAIDQSIEISKISDRIISDKNTLLKPANPNSFKYFETQLISTKDVTFSESDPSMLDTDFTEFCKTANGRKYNVLRFDRKHNIKSFDFVLTYSQIADWGAEKFNTSPVTKTFIGSMVFTGCSNIKDTKTYENIPLEAHVRFESIGDGIGNESSIDGFGDNKGGPSFTFTYSYTKDYVYIFVSSITPFRLVPKEDGSFVDFSYVEGRGSFTGEKRDAIVVKGNKEKGLTKSVPYVSDKDIHFDLSISIKDTSISSTDSNFETIDISSNEFDINADIISTNAKTFTIRPTKGEVVTYGMTPSSNIDLEIASDVAPVKYNSRLLVEDMPKVEDFAVKLEDLIKRSSTAVDKIPFVIKTTVRLKSKYNVRGNYYVDSNVDSFGKIYITEVGTYDAKLDKFEITNRVFDDSHSSGNDTVAGFRKLSGTNVSSYLKSITKDTPDILYTSKSDKVLSRIRDISFKAPENLSVYSEVSFIRNADGFDCVKSFIEFKSENNYDDVVVYFNADKSIKICKFSDYDMSTAVTMYPFDSINLDECNRGLSMAMKITDVTRVYEDNKYKYFVCTNLGLLAIVTIDDVTLSKTSVEYVSAFRENSKYGTDETVSVVHSDDKYIVFAGTKGNVSLYDVVDKKFKYFTAHLDANEKVTAVSYQPDTYIIFATSKRVVTYDLVNDTWILDEDSTGIKRVDTRYNKNELPINSNTDFIPDNQGFEGVQSIQIGNYRYYLGLRKDTSGYSPVYKKIDLKTGRVVSLSRPSEEMYASQLFTDGRYIYSIGGYKVRLETTDQETLYNVAIHNGNQILHDIVSPETVKDRIFKYDVVTDSWVDLPSTEFTLKTSVFDNDISENRKLVHCSPIIVNDKIYIFKPLVREFILNNVGEMVEREVCDNALYILSFVDDSINTEERRIGEIPDYEYTDSSMYPIEYKDGNIDLVFGSRKLATETVDGHQQLRFDHYDFYRMSYNIDSDTYTVVNHTEIKDEYFDNMYAIEYGESKEDLLANSAICDSRNVLIAYAEKVFFFYDKTTNAVSFKPLYSEYDNQDPTTEDSKRLLESNKYEVEWKSAYRDPLNVTISDLYDGRFLIVGGNVFRIPIILDAIDISSPVLYKTPTTVPSVQDDSSSSILGERNYSDYIRVISTFGLQCESIGIAERKNMVIAMLKQVGYPKPSVYYLDKSNDKHFIWMRDINISNNGDNQYFYDYKGCMLGQFAIFIPESFKRDMMELSSGEADSLEILVYNALNKDDHRVITINEPTRKRVLLHSPICEQAILLYETVDGTVKAMRFVYDLQSASVVTTIMTVNGSLDIGTLNAEWNSRPQSIVSGGAYGSKSFVVSSNGIVVFDYDKLLLGQLSYKELPNLFNDTCCSRSVTYDDNYVYIAGGSIYNGFVDAGSSLYKIRIDDLVKSEGYVPREISTINIETSANFNPMYSSPDKLYVYGKSKHLDSYSVSLAVMSEVDKRSIVYRDAANVVNIGKIMSSQYNRHKPTLHSMNIGGKQFLLAISGQQGSGTDLTKFVDLFDVARRKWVTLPELPVILKNVNFIGDTIVGATKVEEDSSERSYLHLIKLICNDYDLLDFSWEDVTVSDALSVSKFMTNRSTDKQKIVVVGVNDSDTFLNEQDSTLLYTLGNDGYTYESFGTIALNSQLSYKVLGIWYDDADDSVKLALVERSKPTEIIIWKHSSIDGWTQMFTQVIEDLNIDTGKRFVFDRSLQGFTFADVKDAYMYYSNDTTMKVVLFQKDGTVLVKDLIDLYNRYNNANVTRFSELVTGCVGLSPEGYVFTYSSSNNEYYMYLPTNGKDRYSTLCKLGLSKSNVESYGYDGNNLFICTKDMESKRTLYKFDLTSNDISVICKDLEELQSAQSINIVDKTLVAIYPDSSLCIIPDLSSPEPNLVVDILNYRDGLSSIDVNGKWAFKLDNLIVIRLNCTRRADNTVEHRMLAYDIEDELKCLFDICVEQNSIPVCISNDFVYYVTQTSGDSYGKLSIHDIKNDRLNSEYQYRGLRNTSILNLSNGTFVLFDNNKNRSCVKYARIDQFDKLNPLRYNDNITNIVFDQYMDTDIDIVGKNDHLYLPFYGSKIELFGNINTDYLANDGIFNRVIEYNDKVFHFTKTNEIDGDKNCVLNVYDKTNAYACLSSISLYSSVEDTISDDLDVPVSLSLPTFVHTIDNVDYIFIYSTNESVLYKINTVSGAIIRYNTNISAESVEVVIEPTMINSAFYLFRNKDGNDAVYKYDIVANEFTELFSLDRTKYTISSINTICDNGYMTLNVVDTNGNSASMYIDSIGNMIGLANDNVYDENRRLDCYFIQYDKKYYRCGEKEEINCSKFDTYRTYTVGSTRFIQHILNGTTCKIAVPDGYNIRWESEAGGILFIGIGTDTELNSILAYMYDSSENKFIDRSFNGSDIDANLRLCIGTSLGLTTDKYIDAENSTVFEDHNVLSNNYGTNKLFEFNLVYPVEFKSAKDAFFDFSLHTTELYLFDGLSDDELHKTHLIKGRNNSIIVLGDNSSTSRVMIFDDKYDGAKRENFSFNREGKTLFIFEVMDTIYVGTTVSDTNKTMIKVYELSISKNSTIVRQFELGQMIIPKLLVGKNDILVYSENDRMPSIESVSTFCPVVLFIDTIIPVSEYNQAFIGTNYEFSSGKGPIKEMTPLSVELDSNKNPVVSFFKNSENVRLLKMAVNKRLFTNKYREYYGPTDGYVQTVSSNDSHLYASNVNNIVKFYNDKILNPETTDNIVRIGNKIIEIINIDGTTSVYSGIDYPFNENLLNSVSTYTKEGYEPNRFIVFTDKKGNVSTYDRDLKVFVDVNGEISVDVPFFSSEIKIYPTKVKIEGQVAKRVWAFSDQNPYPSDDGSCATDDETLLTE